MAWYVLSPTLPATFTFTNIAWYIYNIYFHQHCLAHLHLFSPTLSGTSTPSIFTTIAWHNYIYFHQHCLVHLHLLAPTLSGTSTPSIFTTICLVQLHLLSSILPCTTTTSAWYKYKHLLSPILPCTTSTFTHIALYNYNTCFHQYCLVQQHLPGISTPTFTNTALYNKNICLV